MPFVDGPNGPVEVLVTGRGQPTTVIAHGLAGSIAETRPFGSGVLGSRVFLHFRGHGATATPETPWTYSGLQGELESVVCQYGARRALGVSLGSGALLRSAFESPHQYDRLVFVLPATIDQPRAGPAIQRVEELRDLVQQEDFDAVAKVLVSEQPARVRERRDVALWAARQARRLAYPALTRALRQVAIQHPLDAGADLSGIACPVLVVGQDGDAAHPGDLARELAARLPSASVRIFDGDGLVWGNRAELRKLISSFLNDAG